MFLCCFLFQKFPFFLLFLSPKAYNFIKISFINVSHHILWIMLHERKCISPKSKPSLNKTQHTKKNHCMMVYIFFTCNKRDFYNVKIGMLESLKCKQTNNNNNKKQHKNHKMKMKWKMFQLQSLYEYFSWISLIISANKSKTWTFYFSLW